MAQPIVNMSFDIDVARDVGTDAAIIYQNIRFWVAKNMANNKHHYDGKYWTFNSVSAFEKLFPWLSTQNIRTAIKKLESKNYIVIGTYNKKRYDKTAWYSICENQQMDLLELTNGSVRTNKPIPDINTDIKTVTMLEEKNRLILETIKTKAGLLSLPGTTRSQLHQSNLIRKKFEEVLSPDCSPEELAEAVAKTCSRMKEDEYLAKRFGELKLFYHKIPLYSPLFKSKKEVYL